MNKENVRMFIDGKEVGFAVLSFSIEDFHGGDGGDGGVLMAKECIEDGSLNIEWTAVKLSETLRKLPKPKKESWQNNGKRKKPRVE